MNKNLAKIVDFKDFVSDMRLIQISETDLEFNGLFKNEKCQIILNMTLI